MKNKNHSVHIKGKTCNIVYIVVRTFKEKILLRFTTMKHIQ